MYDENMETIQRAINYIYASKLRTSRMKFKSEEAYQEHLEEALRLIEGLNNIVDSNNGLRRYHKQQPTKYREIFK